MTRKQLRLRLAQFMAEHFREDVRSNLPGWNGTAEDLLPCIDPLRDAPYVIWVIRKEGIKGYDDLLELAKSHLANLE